MSSFRIVILSFFFLFSSLAFASHASIDKGCLFSIKKLLGPYPAKGSVEEKRDFDILLEYQNTRTHEQCENAEREVSVKFATFFGGENGPLTKKEVKKLNFFFFFHFLKSGIASTIGKKIFKRPRPYLANDQIQPCIEKEKSYAYPSGHTAVSRYWAHMLARKYPERAEAFFKRADEVANNRILGGVHHPTDIEAGKKLADAMAIKHLSDEKLILKLQSL